MAKYKSKKTTVDGITFDSKKEARRYEELRFMLRAKLITDLELQPAFTLQESFTDSEGNKHRQIKYIADFMYFDIKKNIYVVEDVKGFKTAVYKIKKKLFLYKFKESKFIFREI